MRSRNVLTRAERLAILADEDRWSEGNSVFGLPKVRQRKSSAGSKSKSKAGEETTAEEGTQTNETQEQSKQESAS